MQSIEPTASRSRKANEERFFAATNTGSRDRSLTDTRSRWRLVNSRFAYQSPRRMVEGLLSRRAASAYVRRYFGSLRVARIITIAMIVDTKLESVESPTSHS